MESAQQLATAAAHALTAHKYGEAEELYRRVIHMVDTSTEPGVPGELDVAQCFNSLADLLEKQNKHEEAEQLKKRSVQIAAKQLNEIDGFDR